MDNESLFTLTLDNLRRLSHRRIGPAIVGGAARHIWPGRNLSLLAVYLMQVDFRHSAQLCGMSCENERSHLRSGFALFNANDRVD